MEGISQDGKDIGGGEGVVASASVRCEGARGWALYVYKAWKEGR